ncbi:hypothetical protein ACFLQ0_02350 [Nitrospinota bacterium]
MARKKAGKGKKHPGGRPPKPEGPMERGPSFKAERADLEAFEAELERRTEAGEKWTPGSLARECFLRGLRVMIRAGKRKG